DDEDARCLGRRDERRAPGPGERHAEQCKRDEEEHRGDVAPEGTPADDGREHVDVRERDRVAHPPSLEEGVEADRERHREERQQQERVAEAHLPPAQTAETWTTPAPPPPPAETTTRSRITLTRAERLETSCGVGGFAVRNPRALYAATRCSSPRQPTEMVRVAVICTVRTRRTVGLPGGTTPVKDVGVRLPPPLAGTQPAC